MAACTVRHTRGTKRLCASAKKFIPCLSLLDTIPVSSSTDWQAAFGFGSSAKQQQQQEDDLGFDPFDVTRKALADLIEKELSVQEASPRSPSLLPNGQPRLPPLQHRGLYNSFSLPTHGHATPGRQPWMGLPTRNNLAHLNHITHSHFLDPNCPPQHHSTGLGGITISGACTRAHIHTRDLTLFKS